MSESGPVSIVLSRGSQRIVVYRNGIEIGRARLTITGDEPFAAHALVLAEGPSEVPASDAYVPDPAKFRWLKIGVPGHLGEAGTNIDPVALARIKIPPEFVSRVNPILTLGASVFVTDARLSAKTSGPVQVVDSDPPAGKKNP